jgi:1-acyl-sn-glycerol-3-phosphate acyltransferase
MEDEALYVNGHAADSADESIFIDDEVDATALREQLLVELNKVIDRLRAIDPEFVPLGFSAEEAFSQIGRGVRRLTPRFAQGWLDQLGMIAASVDPFDADTYRGIWFLISYTAQSYADVAKRRAAGDFETDEYGFDPEFNDAVRPLVDFLYTRYWRVTTLGIDHVPNDGEAAILVANHSGQLPFDAAMISTAVATEHFDERMVRPLYASRLSSVPVLASLLNKTGYASDSAENADSLLEQGNLIAVFPEGLRGSGKLFWDRYQMAPFNNDNFVKLALRHGAPIIPVAVVGGEETYIAVHNARSVADLLRIPYFPITLRFPWLGLLAAVPYPTKWTIEFGAPLDMAEYEPDSAENEALVAQLNARTHRTIQTMLNERVARRDSVFRS